MTAVVVFEEEFGQDFPEVDDAVKINTCYSQGTMSAINGDKARFHRERKSKLARRERSKGLRKKITDRLPARPNGGQL